jgi:ribosomal protein S18 acetylase RimI-like enzyme
VDPPFHKDYGPIADQLEEIRAMDCALIAQNDGGVVGFAAATYEAWNHRVNLWHLYVAPGHRRTGVATALIHHVEAFARSVGARCLRPETQNTNYPAIRFYRRMGFRLCGLDESLYDPEETVRDEIALFLVREVV